MFLQQLKRTLVTGAALALVFSYTVPSVSADVKVKDEESGIEMRFGGRLQSQFIINDSQFGEDEEFKVRRARFRFGIKPHEIVDMFMQTEFVNEKGAGTGEDMRVIDAFATLSPDSWLQLVSGLRMAPTSRQVLTSSGAMLAFDRPAVTNYSLTWGLRGNGSLQNRAIPGTTGGSLGDTAVRDLGATLFGTGSFSDDFHGKYYLAVGEGSVEGDDTNRYSARVQFNFGDAEPGYFNSATYLNTKRTFGVGFAYDTQDDVAMDSVTSAGLDYEWYAADVFVEQPLGGGALTAEAGFHSVDLGDPTGSLMSFDDGRVLGVPGMQVQGEGFYFQTGYYYEKWQPFAIIESWNADAAGSAGDWLGYRVGLAYYLHGHNAAIKTAFEHIDNDTPGEDDSIETVSTGIFITF